MKTIVFSYWREHPPYWLPLTPKQKEIADKDVYERFYDYDASDEDLWGRVVYLDQFHCHFQRFLGRIDESVLRRHREHAARLVLQQKELLKNADEVQLVFGLMPFKHLGQFDFIFETIHHYWGNAGGHLAQYPVLHRFHNDTYRKAYGPWRIQAGIQSDVVPGEYDSNRICEYYPEKYKSGAFLQGRLEDKLRVALEIVETDRPIVSLSGGVDSNVLLAGLRLLGKWPIAVHILYGNRAESDEEFLFIQEYCRRCGVPLFTYKIEHLRRNNVDRNFYESMTRDIRFEVYKAVGGANPQVILGHIKEDAVENVWTNLCKNEHLADLVKMSFRDVQRGVALLRPFLSVEKKCIFECSRSLGIPFLKNTTPSWSNRGKFRNRFSLEIETQFGNASSDNVIRAAQTIRNQFLLLEKILFQPLFDSFVDNRCTATPAVAAGLDATGWAYIFEVLCHRHLKCRKPGIHAVSAFVERLGRFSRKHQNSMRVEMKKGLSVAVVRDKSEVMLLFLRV